MKRKAVAAVLAMGILILNISGCGFNTAAKSNIPYPAGWVVQDEEEMAEKEVSDEEKNEEAGNSEIEPGEADETGTEKESDASTEGTEKESDASAEETVKETLSDSVNYFFDTSASMVRSPEVIQVHSAASRAGAGHEKNYYGIDSKKNLIETNEQLCLSGQYGYGALIDIIKTADIPVKSDGVNVLTTDMQSTTTGTEIGEWLVSIGCTGYSFYVFTMKYDGSVDFLTYTSNTVQEYISVSGCSFDREFLMIVFGDDSQVQEYDENFQMKLGDELTYDMCHVAMEEEGEQNVESILNLVSSKCFDDNLANITYSGTNYCYGLEQVDNTEKYTLENTFVYKKSRKSANEDTDAVKAVLYADFDAALPELSDKMTDDMSEVDVSGLLNKEISVMEYDDAAESFVESSVDFSVNPVLCFDGIAAAPEDEELNTKLGGNLAAAGTAAFMVTVENTDLPEGIYAVEVRLSYEEEEEAVTLQSFASAHSAGLEDYTKALKTECVAKTENGTVSRTQYTRTASGPSVYSRLLEFERLADELAASGAETENDTGVIAFRLIIDNH